MCGHGASSLHKDKMCDTSPVMSSDQIKCIIACVHAYLTGRLKLSCVGISDSRITNKAILDNTTFLT